MKSLSKLLLGLAYLVCVVVCENAIADLTPDTFDTFISDHDIVLVQFYAPWCKVCQEVEPIVEEAAIALERKNLVAARVDCNEFSELCSTYRIAMFPTFLIFKGLDDRRAYNGPREVEEIVKYMEKHSLPATTLVDRDNLESFMNSGEVVIMGSFDVQDRESQNTFLNVAKELRDDFDFGITTDTQLIQVEDHAPPFVTVFKKFDDGKSLYTGPMNENDITTFIMKMSTPWIHEFNVETSQHYFKNRIPLTFLVHDGQAPPERLIEELKPVAKGFKDSLQIVTLEYSEKLLSKLRFKPERLPTLFTINSDNSKYALEPTNDLNTFTGSAFLHAFTKGKLPEYFLSERVPPQNDDSVAVVVRDNFQELVMNNDKDVLVEFYAPYCGHCKAFAPEYEKLAESYHTSQDLITIAKVNAIDNDIPNERIVSFPTFKLFRAGDKENPVKFEGNRSVENIAKFIEENRTHRIQSGDEEL